MQNESNRLDHEGWEEEFFNGPEDEFEIAELEWQEKQRLAELFGLRPGRWETEWS